MTSLKSMRTYVRVVQSGSFAAASESLGLSPSMVSKQISLLERHLGARLLQRSTRAMAVTEIGEAYYASCQTIIAQVNGCPHDRSLLPANLFQFLPKAAPILRVIGTGTPRLPQGDPRPGFDAESQKQES